MERSREAFRVGGSAMGPAPAHLPAFQHHLLVRPPLQRAETSPHHELGSCQGFHLGVFQQHLPLIEKRTVLLPAGH